MSRCPRCVDSTHVVCLAEVERLRAASFDDRALRERIEHIVDGWVKWLVKHGPNRVSVAPMMQSCLDELREALAGAAPSAPPTEEQPQ